MSQGWLAPLTDLLLHYECSSASPSPSPAPALVGLPQSISHVGHIFEAATDCVCLLFSEPFSHMLLPLALNKGCGLRGPRPAARQNSRPGMQGDLALTALHAASIMLLQWRLLQAAGHCGLPSRFQYVGVQRLGAAPGLWRDVLQFHDSQSGQTACPQVRKNLGRTVIELAAGEALRGAELMGSPDVMRDICGCVIGTLREALGGRPCTKPGCACGGGFGGSREVQERRWILMTCHEQVGRVAQLGLALVADSMPQASGPEEASNLAAIHANLASLIGTVHQLRESALCHCRSQNVTTHIYASLNASLLGQAAAQQC